MSTLLAQPLPVQPPAAALHARGAQQYFQSHVQSRTPIEMVVMLYDGALRHLGQARHALASNDMITKRDALSKGLAIVTELQGMLNMEDGGEIAARLDGLYTYIQGCCLDANTKRDPAHLDEALRLLTTLRGAWAQIGGAPPAAA